MYAKGRGVKQDHGRAARLAERACALGDAGGCRELGVLCWEGLGVAKDADKAESLSGRACDAGDDAACKNLVMVLESRCGEGLGAACLRLARWLAPNPVTAERASLLTKRACTLGIAEACPRAPTSAPATRSTR